MSYGISIRTQAPFAEAASPRPAHHVIPPGVTTYVPSREG